jgi:hypothetical protein
MTSLPEGGLLAPNPPNSQSVSAVKASQSKDLGPDEERGWVSAGRDPDSPRRVAVWLPAEGIGLIA